MIETSQVGESLAVPADASSGDSRLAWLRGARTTRSDLGPPPSDPLAATIWEALGRHDTAATVNAWRRMTFAVFAAALGPLGGVLLGIQILVLTHGSPWAIRLTALEVIALAVALAIGYMRIGRAHERWINERLRAELIRREAFLCAARVGPYLRTPSPAPSRVVVTTRLRTLESDENEPASLLILNDPANGSWAEALENERHRGVQGVLPSLPAAVSEYVARRVGDQRRWFSRAAKNHRNHAHWWENGAKLILALAFLIASVDLGILMYAAPAADDAFHVGLTLAALVLPPIGAALVGLLSIFGCHRLTRSYTHHARALEDIECALLRLEGELESKARPADEISFDFKRLVLRTEELLSGELRQWWLIMRPEAPKAGP